MNRLLMLRHASRVLLVAALMVSIGLHWAVLQSAAWAGMIVRYSVQEGSLITGLSQTFDNEHPCALCCAIKQGAQSEKNSSEKKTDTEKKLVLVLQDREQPMLTPPDPCLLREGLHLTAAQRHARPPTPPPRRGCFFALVG